MPMSSTAKRKPRLALAKVGGSARRVIAATLCRQSRAASRPSRPAGSSRGLGLHDISHASVCSHNVMRVKAIGEPIAPIRAKNNRKEAMGERGEKETNLQSKLILCKKTKFRLTVNLWTSRGEEGCQIFNMAVQTQTTLGLVLQFPAGLTNGAEGTVEYIIYRQGKG